MHVSDRLKQERHRLSLSQEELARLCGVSKRAQASYESGERSPRAEYLEAAAGAGVDVHFVLTGQVLSGQVSAGSASTGAASSGASRAAVETPEGVREAGIHYLSGDRASSGADLHPNGTLPVPMYDIEAAAGAGRIFDAERIEATFYLPAALFEADGVDPAQVVGVTARGDSMGDTIRDREQVLVNRAQRTPDGVFLLRMDDELRLKRVQRVAGGAWILISDNPAYERELIKPDDLASVEIIGQCWRKVGRVF
ncbi:XRE family transcriptional regulator [Salinicola endophyticus]|uniref:XRE family transcriptional regulator n=1 Tax=Salinicola endophyticus TaxID=1949083 RepID=UPI00249B0DEA|nr:LexA family transcriptional regulator [Salinicola endophyticus]